MQAVIESERSIPVAFNVDVVVVGGTTGAVAAAIEAAARGASVFLAAPRPYLGEDVCATLRLWLEKGELPASPLERTLFGATERTTLASVPFSCRADRRPKRPHLDALGEPINSDGIRALPAPEGIRYDGDVVLDLDCGEMRPLAHLHLRARRKAGECGIGTIGVSTSDDGETWREGSSLNCPPGGDEMTAVTLSVPIETDARHVRATVALAEGCREILIDEIALEPVDLPSDGGIRGRAPRPLQIQRKLDRALLDAGVSFLYSCRATDLLRDAHGRPSGIVMANRAGRQAVTAKVVIDATPRATVARLADAPFRPFPAGQHRFRRVVIGGGPVPGIDARKIGLTYASAAGLFEIIEYGMEIEMPDASPASFAAAEQEARDLTWHPGTVAAAAELFSVPPDAMRAARSVEDGWPGALRVDLDAFRPLGIDRLYVLGGCADLTRAAAERMLRPLEFIALGTRVGAAAAEDLARISPAGGHHVAGDLPVGARPGEVRELLNGIRPVDEPDATVPSDESALAILGNWDVVVVGGGTGGAPATIAAARQGARTLLVEAQPGLGGVETLGMINRYYHGNRVGFTTEIDEGIEALGADVPAIAKGEYFRREARAAGAEIWSDTTAVGALVEGGRITGVVVATPQGRGIVEADCIIDATGNSDVAAAAGAETTFVDGEHVAMQGTGLPGIYLGASYTNTDYTFADDGDILDAWRLYLLGRERFADAFEMGTLIDTRERRRIVADLELTPIDIITDRTWPDTVVVTKSDFDSHGYTVHPVFVLRPPYRDGDDLHCNLPYRSMLPKGLDGLIVIGLGTSAHRDAVPIIRMQPDIQNQGYAAGVAAAMATEETIPPREIDVRALQRHLVTKEILPEEPLIAEDSWPLPDEQIAEAVAAAAGGYRVMGRILADTARSIPMLREALAAAPDDEAKLVYAQILGTLGEPDGADLLREAIARAEWDEGWNFRGMGQYGHSLSPLDSRIIALGRARDADAIEVIIEKVRALSPESAFSHIRACAMALETLRDPRGAEPLARILAQGGIGGHAATVIGPSEQPRDTDRNDALKEIVLARALYRCGDHEGLGERTLREYARDLRGIFARHASAILGEPT